MSRVIASVLVAASLGFTAMADQTDGIEQTGEALAWTVAAYGSCDDALQLQRDFKKEAATLNSDFNEILGALVILEDASNVCGMKNAFAANMRQLATTDISSFEAKLMTFDDPPAPVFEIDHPEGSGEAQTSVILEAANSPPPLSSGATSPTSDYQQ